jgi:hypothetical protein
VNTRYVLYGSLAVVALLLFARKSISNPNITDRWGNTIYRDMSMLVPPFAKKIDELFARLRARGYDPFLNETYRTPERSLKLSTIPEHTGIKVSQHNFGLAVDVLNRNKKQGFWDALGEESEKLGLTWGGTFSNRDVPHVQAAPAAFDGRIARMEPSERETYVRGLYA